MWGQQNVVRYHVVCSRSRMAPPVVSEQWEQAFTLAIPGFAYKVKRSLSGSDLSRQNPFLTSCHLCASQLTFNHREVALKLPRHRRELSGKAGHEFGEGPHGCRFFDLGQAQLAQDFHGKL